MTRRRHSPLVDRKGHGKFLDHLCNETNIVDVLRRRSTATHATVPCQQLLAAGLCIRAIGIHDDELIRFGKTVESAIGFELFAPSKSAMKRYK